MELLFATYDGTLQQALMVSGVVGALLGLILWTVVSSGEGQHRVGFGMLIGLVFMGVFQFLRVGQVVGGAYAESFRNFGDAQTAATARMIIDGFYRMVEAAIIGGVIMIVLFSPLTALKGALAGLVIGLLSGVVGWFVLIFVDFNVPNMALAVIVIIITVLVYDASRARGGRRVRS